MRAEKMWDRLAGNWDTPGVSLGRRDINMIEKARKYLNAESTVLDYGCATGSVALEIVKDVKEIYGVDISQNMIEQALRKAQERNITNVHFIKGSIFNEALGKESFDVITAFSVLHLVEDLPEVMKRLHSLLKPGGYLIVEAPCLGENRFPNIFLNVPVLIASRTGILPKLSTFNAASIKRMIAGNDFQIIEEEFLKTKPVTEVFITARKA